MRIPRKFETFIYHCRQNRIKEYDTVYCYGENCIYWNFCRFIQDKGYKEGYNFTETDFKKVKFLIKVEGVSKDDYSAKRAT